MLMYSEEDLLMLSGIQHLLFCERQWALIHIEGAWSENRLTVEGRHLHERVHEAGDETRDGVRIARGIRLRSLWLGLVGQADVVEFQATPEGERVFPVEYKRGRPKPDRCDEVQLCAQAMCLEEMLGIAIVEGAIFYGQPRRRHAVTFDDALRNEVERSAERMQTLFRAGVTPPAQYEPKCRNCSLVEICLPKSAGAGKSVRRYLDKLWESEDV